MFTTDTDYLCLIAMQLSFAFHVINNLIYFLNVHVFYAFVVVIS